MMCKREKSRSDVQTKMEKTILKAKHLESEEQNINDIKLVFDGVKKENGKITEIYEIYCGLEKLKPAQKQKIAKDLLKMIFFEKLTGQKYEKKIVVVDRNIRDSLSIEKHKTWLNQALDDFNVTIEFFQITDTQLREIEEAKKNQNITQK